MKLGSSSSAVIEENRESVVGRQPAAKAWSPVAGGSAPDTGKQDGDGLQARFAMAPARIARLSAKRPVGTSTRRYTDWYRGQTAGTYGIARSSAVSRVRAGSRDVCMAIPRYPARKNSESAAISRGFS
jgi:hypothetical protein